VNTNVTYSITVPQGEHQIFVDNQGIDWMKIAEYVFTNFAVSLRCYALKSSDEVIGWVHNRNFNWRYIRDIGNLPPVINDGKVFVNDIIPNSIYTVEWWNTQNSTIVRMDTVIAITSSLSIDVPPIVWDYAFILKRISSTQVVTEELEKKKVNYLFENYPNPFNSATKIRFYLSEPDYVTIIVYNMLGEEIRTLVDRKFYPSGEFEIEFDASQLNSGIYFYKMETNKASMLRKMVLIK
jgi:hypothetical protein